MHFPCKGIDGVDIVEYGAFSQFYFNKMSGHAVFTLFLDDFAEEVAVHQVEAREVHRDGNTRQALLKEGFQELEDLFVHDHVEFDDKARLFAHGNEFVGEDEFALAGLPAHQRFAAHEDAAVDVHLGLVVRDEFIVLQRLLHGAFQLLVMDRYLFEFVCVIGEFFIQHTLDRAGGRSCLIHHEVDAFGVVRDGINTR